MSKQNKDSLDQFFANRLATQKFEFKEEDWGKMEILLDTAATLRAKERLKKWTRGLGILLIVALLSLFVFDPLGIFRNTSTSTELSLPLNASDQSQTGTETTTETSENSDVTESKSESTSPLEKGSLMEGEVNNEGDNEGNKEEATNSNNDVDTFLDSGGKGGSIVLNEEDQQKEVEILPTTQITSVAENEGSEPGAAAVSGSEPTEGMPINAIAPVGLDVAGFNTISTPKNLLAPAENQTRLRRASTWNFSIALDYSGVSFRNFYGPKFRAGVSYEHFFSNRLSLSFGANFAAKDYTAIGGEYSVPGGYNTPAVNTPDETYATCNVLDIPINLGYYFKVGKATNLRITAGISSWLMLTEDYEFYYEVDDPQNLDQWSVRNENQHLFSIVNLGVGVEQRLSNRFSVMVEPYLNIPLGGVGYGSVDLYSTGLRIAFRTNKYRLIKTNVSE